MTKQNFIKRYSKNTKEIQEYMSFIANALIEKHADIPETFIISLDLLAQNLEVMASCVKEMSKENGMLDDDRYHGKKKSAPLQTYFQAQGYVNNILANFGFTPSSKAKINKDKEEVNVQDFLAQLTA